MSKCPTCGAGLEIILDTNYSKATAALSGADLTNEQLSNLKWKQSQKKPALSTILVDQAILGVPIAKLLYDALTRSANKSLKFDRTEYKLSTYNGNEFLQRWSPVS